MTSRPTSPTKIQVKVGVMSAIICRLVLPQERVVSTGTSRRESYLPTSLPKEIGKVPKNKVLRSRTNTAASTHARRCSLTLKRQGLTSRGQHRHILDAAN